MKFKAFSSVALALLLILAPTAAQATTILDKDPGSLPIDEILSQEGDFTPDKNRVYDSGQVLTPTEEANLQRVLQKVGERYGVEVIAEYVRTFPTDDPQGWSYDRSVQLGVEGYRRPAIYINISVNDRVFWTNPNAKFTPKVDGEKTDEIIQKYAVPEFKQNRWVRGMAILGEDLGRAYHGLPLFDTASSTTPNSNSFPTVTPTESPLSEVAPVTEDSRTEAEKQADMKAAQDRLDGLKSGGGGPNAENSSDSKAESVDPGQFFFGFLVVMAVLVGLGIIATIVIVATKAAQTATAKKQAALRAIENRRIKGLVDQLVPRLRHSEEFLSSSTEEELVKIADKASFAVFGLKGADKDRVIKEAISYVKQEQATGATPRDTLDSTELMNLSIKAFGEKKNKLK